MKRKVAVVLALSMIVSGPAAPQLTARAAEDITIEEAFEESDEEESLSFEEDDFSDDEEEFLSFDEDVTLDFEEDEESLQEAPEPVADKEASTGIVIEDGMAQPTVKYSEIKPGYTNEGSDILRFAVYIETDYDTDEDGKKDLVQAVIQVPKAAAEQFCRHRRYHRSERG